MHTNNLPIAARRRARNLARNARRRYGAAALVLAQLGWDVGGPDDPTVRGSDYIRARARVAEANRDAALTLDKMQDTLMRMAVAVLAVPEGAAPPLAWWEKDIPAERRAKFARFTAPLENPGLLKGVLP